jgi:hypothetical protein
MKAFKIRCSAIGKIMTNPRTKGELLSQTAKTYIEEEVLRAKYGIIKTFSSRYTDKGNLVEDEAIDMASNALEIGFLYKNHEHFENDFLTGTPDVNTNDILAMKQEVEDQIVKSVLAKYVERSSYWAKEIRNYIRTRNDLTLEQWITHLQEELMDATLVP